MLEQPGHGLHVSQPLTGGLLASLLNQWSGHHCKYQSTYLAIILRSAGDIENLAEILSQSLLFVQNNPVLLTCKVHLLSNLKNISNHDVCLKFTTSKPTFSSPFWTHDRPFLSDVFTNLLLSFQIFFTAHTSSSHSATQQKRQHE